MKRPFIDSTQDYITAEAVAGSSTKMVPVDSVLCVMRSGILRHTFPVAVNTVAVTLNQDMRALSLRSDVEPRYLSYYLQFSGRTVLDIASKGGTTVNSIEASRLDRHLVPLMERERQQKIVARIDELFTEIDDGETALARARADLGTWRKVLLKAAVTGELTADWRTANPPTETGSDLLNRLLAERRIRWQAQASSGKKLYLVPIEPVEQLSKIMPESWTTASMPQLGDFGRGKSKHRPRNDPRLYGGAYPFVQTGIVSESRGKIRRYEQTYTEFGLAQSKLWPVGTVCITIAANIAKTGVLQFDACFPDSVVGLTCSSGVSPAYIELVIRTLQQGLEDDAPATAQKNINLEVLETLGIPLPPSDEQLAIVAAFEEAEVAGDFLVRRDLDQAAATLRQSILAAAFRGDLS